MSAPEYHVLTRKGDSRPEVDRTLAELKRAHGAEVDAGFHKYMHVTQTNMTVVMVHSVDSLLAAALRGRPGWTEPGLVGGN
ncbi:MAG TPA: hypothetical protein VK399_06810 [Longimicrobiaceae bacterium]|jgi:hypothetical protein|nr:hypothetical protein [Longimicrobiaceae bacterium]